MKYLYSLGKKNLMKVVKRLLNYKNIPEICNCDSRCNDDYLHTKKVMKLNLTIRSE